MNDEIALHSSDSGSWPTARATDGSKGGPNQRGSSGDLMLPSAVHLWPTATSDTSNRDKRYAQGELPLTAAVLWPTPNTMTGGQTSRGGDRKGEALLGAMVKWPTAGANDWKGSAKVGQRRGQLDEAVEQKWPTPKSEPSGPDFARSGRPERGGDDLSTKVVRAVTGSLNPDWVELLMGWPAGWTSPEPLDALDWPAAHGAWPAPPGPQHDWEPPRVAVGVKDRVKRLKALGNGQVPKTAYLAWHLLCSSDLQ